MGKDLKKLVEKAKKAHEETLFSLDQWHRSGAGTATAKKHWERYETRKEAFEAAMSEIESLVCVT